MTTKILGYEFVEFSTIDKMTFGGAEPGCLICNISDDLTLIWDPTAQTISEVYAIINDKDGSFDAKERLWSFTQVLG